MACYAFRILKPKQRDSTPPISREGCHFFVTAESGYRSSIPFPCDQFLSKLSSRTAPSPQSFMDRRPPNFQLFNQEGGSHLLTLRAFCSSLCHTTSWPIGACFEFNLVRLVRCCMALVAWLLACLACNVQGWPAPVDLFDMFGSQRCFSAYNLLD